MVELAQPTKEALLQVGTSTPYRRSVSTGLRNMFMQDVNRCGDATSNGRDRLYHALHPAREDKNGPNARTVGKSAQAWSKVRPVTCSSSIARDARARRG